MMEDDSKMKQTKSSDLWGDTYEHPSFATLYFGRTQGHGTPLFGSSILNRNTIRMEIHHAEYNRHTGADFIHSRKPILIASMSATQFADIVTGLNVGGGHPITLKYTEKDGDIPQPEFINKREQFENEFKKTTDDIISRIDDLSQKLTEKKAAKWITHELDVIKSWLKANHPFMAEQFEEQMERSVLEAKNEVDAHINAVIQQTGLEALRGDTPLLLEMKETECEQEE